MKNLFLIFIVLFVSCFGDEEPECEKRTWKCSENKVYYCGTTEEWQILEDCDELNKICITDYPEIQINDNHIASCEELE